MGKRDKEETLVAFAHVASKEEGKTVILFGAVDQ